MKLNKNTSKKVTFIFILIDFYIKYIKLERLMKLNKNASKKITLIFILIATNLYMIISNMFKIKTIILEINDIK